MSASFVKRWFAGAAMLALLAQPLPPPIALATGNPPVATADTATLPDGTDIVMINVLANDTDPESGALTLEQVVLTGAMLGFPHGSGSLIAYERGAASFRGSDTFQYVIMDTEGLTATGSVTVDVQRNNTAPTVNADAYTVPQNEALYVEDRPEKSILFNDTDVDDDMLFAELDAGPSHGVLTLNEDGTFSYVPTTGFAGTDGFTYRATDHIADSATGSVTITVHSTNATPTVGGDSYSVHAGGTLALRIGSGVLVNDGDGDGDVLAAVEIDAPAHGDLELASNGTFTYVPDAGFAGSDSFTYKADDGAALSSTATVSITVSNSAPTGSGDTFTAIHDRVFTNDFLLDSVLMNDSDPEDDDLSVVVPSMPPFITTAHGGSVTIASNGTFSYTPPANFTGSDLFSYRLTDGIATATGTVSLTVTDAAPHATDDYFFTRAGGTSLSVSSPGYLLNDNDADGDTYLLGTLVAGPSHGTLIFYSNGGFIYTPTYGYTGTDSFTYKVRDGMPGLKGSNVATVYIEVAAACGGYGYGSSAGGGGSCPTVPSVSVRGTETDMWAGISDTGALTIVRTGSTASGLLVDFAWGGEATYGTDYTASSTGSVIIPAGATGATVVIMPTATGALGVRSKSVALTIIPRIAYALLLGSHAIAPPIGEKPQITVDQINGGQRLNMPYPDDVTNGNLNKIWNPAGIVIQTAGATTDKTAAIIMITFNNLKLAEKDGLVEWAIKPVARGGKTGAAEFHTRTGWTGAQKNKGRSVALRGVTEGGIDLELRVKGAAKVIETYEAYVLPEKEVSFRVNIWKSVKPEIKALTTVAEAKTHVGIMNIYLRQAGVKMIPDTDGTTKPYRAAYGTITKVENGYFTVSDAPLTLVYNIHNNFYDLENLKAIKPQDQHYYQILRHNARPGISQFAYVLFSEDHSALAQTKGSQPLWLNKARKEPMTRFPFNYRLTAGAAAQLHIARISTPLDTADAHIGALMFDSDIRKEAARPLFGAIMAHEQGHVFSLRHRGIGEYGYDGLTSTGNLMVGTPLHPYLHMDLDMLQTMVIRQNELLK
jgi:VCBS repeat-containing protein